MKKLLLSTLTALSLAVGTQAQLLYKVTADSVAKPSYIVATHDMLNPMGYVDRINGLTEAMTNTDQILFDIDRTANEAALKEAATLPSGKTLASLLSDKQIQTLDAFLKKYTEVSWKSSYNQKRYNGRTPLAVMKDFLQLLFVANHMGEYDPTHTFAQYFEAQAKKNGEATGGIIEADKYIQTLKGLPLEAQAQVLGLFLNHQDQALAIIDKTVDAYKAKDMDAAAAAIGNALGMVGAGNLLAAPVENMEKAIHDKPTLFALPCYLLGGEQGIISKLKAAGYQVEAVD